jgi:hypothetical protein
MTRILLVETAAPKRVQKKALDIIEGSVYPDPEVTILCRQQRETVQLFSGIQGAQIIALPPGGSRRKVIAMLNQKKFDVVQAFWTNEKKYAQMKLLTLKIKSGVSMVDMGDGGNYRLTWRFVIRYWYYRLRHPRPDDYYRYVKRKGMPLDYDHDGERVLLLQTASEGQILQVLERLAQAKIFRNPLYYLFCRNHPGVKQAFKDHPLIHRVWTHSETRHAWRHLRFLRRQRFDGIVVFFTGDPSYTKMKYFAFLVGTRHKIVFNEHFDCFRFAPGRWLSFLAYRFGEHWLEGKSPNWDYRTRSLLFLCLKMLLLPFRFVWLLLVWLRLRGIVLLTENQYDDCPL